MSQEKREKKHDFMVTRSLPNDCRYPVSAARSTRFLCVKLQSQLAIDRHTYGVNSKLLVLLNSCGRFAQPIKYLHCNTRHHMPWPKNRNKKEMISATKAHIFSLSLSFSERRKKKEKNVCSFVRSIFLVRKHFPSSTHITLHTRLRTIFKVVNARVNAEHKKNERIEKATNLCLSHFLRTHKVRWVCVHCLQFVRQIN